MIVIVHDSSYQHKFPLVSELIEYENLRKFNITRLLMLSRIFKLLEKLKINSGVFSIFKTKFMDGYFQSPSIYNDFDPKEVKHALDFLRERLKILQEKDIETLEHIRLADFFKNDIERVEYLKIRVEKLSNKSHILTTDDCLLNNLEIQSILKAKGCASINSSNKTALEIIRIMSRAKCVISNDSTLAFWASVLSNSFFVCQREDLKILHKKFLDY
jgi:hypothetical protein